IPYGKTTTYGDIARQIARKRGLDHMSAQAVGGAVGHNPVSIIVPCHRVLGTNGSLTGYAGGIDKKISLLTLEGAELPASRHRAKEKETMVIRKDVASRRRRLPNPIKQRVPHRENLTRRRHAFLPHRKQFLYHRPCLWKFLQNHAAYRFRIHICKVRVL